MHLLSVSLVHDPGVQVHCSYRILRAYGPTHFAVIDTHAKGLHYYCSAFHYYSNDLPPSLHGTENMLSDKQCHWETLQTLCIIIVGNWGKY